jgi:hypothetical protein
METREIVGICSILSPERSMSPLAAHPGEVRQLVPGPRWPSFEQLRKSGEASLDEIPEHGVATLVAGRGTYKILREADFQELYGLTAELGRMQRGINIVMQAARAYAKNSDAEHASLLISSIMMIANSPVLPTRECRETVAPDSVEAAIDEADDFD